MHKVPTSARHHASWQRDARKAPSTREARGPRILVAFCGAMHLFAKHLAGFLGLLAAGCGRRGGQCGSRMGDRLVWGGATLAQAGPVRVRCFVAEARACFAAAPKQRGSWHLGPSRFGATWFPLARTYVRRHFIRSTPGALPAGRVALLGREGRARRAVHERAQAPQ